MRAFFTGLAAFAATFLIAHFVVLNALPGRIMSAVRGQMIERGMPVHAWAMSPRVTPESQPVVRPSPDLAYAICLIDLSDGPIELSVPAWPEYGSLSIFEADTDNVYASSLDTRAEGTPGTQRVIVALAGQDIPSSGEAEQVILKKPEALALIRRLAPTQAAYEAAAALIPASRCAPL